MLFQSICLQGEKELYSIQESFYNKVVEAKNIVSLYAAGIYLLKVNSRKRCEICSKLAIKTPERCKGVVLVSLLLTLNIFLTLF